MRVALFITCLADNFSPRCGEAAVRVLEHLGCEVDFPEAQTCCGQPQYNNGHWPEATELAKRAARALADHDAVVVPSVSCTVQMRRAAELVPAGDPDHEAVVRVAERAHEFAGFLRNVLGVDLDELGARWEGELTYHPACHLRELGREDDSRALLEEIAGVEQRPLPRAHECCGFGGTFLATQPELSNRMAMEKMRAIRSTGAETVATADAGCGLNIAGTCRRQGVDVRVCSVAEIVAESLGLLERR